MTDSELVKIAKQIDHHNDAIKELMDRIHDSDRPDAEEIYEEMWQNGVNSPALAQACIGHYIDGKNYVWANGGYIWGRKKAQGLVNSGNDTEFSICGYNQGKLKPEDYPE